ncbi:hypothetical protein C0991_005145, partial [Blastosporella zonata]
DDCLAINKGSNIVFKGNTCSGGHGISIVRKLVIIPVHTPADSNVRRVVQGSIASSVTVSGIVISGNTIIN